MNAQYKRFTSEIPHLTTLYDNVEITFAKTQEPNIKITLYDNNITPPFQYIQFILPKEYPFQAPLLYINNKSFLKTLPHIQLSEYRKKIRKPLPFTGECLHCNFILKGSWWSPVIGMKQVLREITNVQKTQRLVQEYILVLHLTNQRQIPKEIADIIHEYL
jgi:hypothetical protein